MSDKDIEVAALFMAIGPVGLAIGLVVYRLTKRPAVALAGSSAVMAAGWGLLWLRLAAPG